MLEKYQYGQKVVGMHPKYHLSNVFKRITYEGLAKKKKIDAWSPCTFFCIKVLGFQILAIGEKHRFQHPEVYPEPCHPRWSVLGK